MTNLPVVFASERCLEVITGGSKLLAHQKQQRALPEAEMLDHEAHEVPPGLRGGLDQRFCEVMDAAPVMIWVSGEDKACVWFNRPWLTFTGRGMTQELGAGWIEGVHPDDLELCLRIYSNHFDVRQEFRMQYRLRRHDGAYRWIDDIGIPRYARDGTFLGYIGSCIDLMPLKEAEIALRESDTRLRVRALGLLAATTRIWRRRGDRSRKIARAFDRVS